jgi:DNA-binding SARP family transcriptional activator
VAGGGGCDGAPWPGPASDLSAALPAEFRELPTIRTLEGQLVWRAGRHAEAIAPLHEAVVGHRSAGDAEREWLARFFLAEALYSTGEFREMLGLADGWDGPGAPTTHAAAAGVAWYKALALLALGRREEAELLADRLRSDTRTAESFQHLDSLVAITIELPAGEAESALTRLRSTIRELELRDQRGRLLLSLMMIGLLHLDLGEVSEGLDWFERCQRESERLGLGFVARGARLQRASLLAQRGELDDARLELERAGQPRSIGWRGVSRDTAEAFVASAAGDGRAAVAAAQRALDTVRPGTIGYRVWAALDMAVVLAENGSPDRARDSIAEAMAALDDHFPAEAGHYHRARLLATRAWLEYDGGDREAAYETLRLCWREAGDSAHLMARAHWSRLRPILWDALADDAIEPEDVLTSVGNALPGGEALVDFTEHPRPAVRRAAIPAALASDHPAVLSRLGELTDDDDEHVASAARATEERLQRRPPPFRFRVLGRFRASRGGWEIADEDWGRPIDSRLVRFLLVNLNRPVTEDLIFEALWPDLSASSARRSLQVAVSRARRVLDPPGAEQSVIRSRDQTYLLALGPRDTVDAEDFLTASEAALGERGEERRALLERARALREGEPLPEERYSDWATAYRERIDDRLISVLTSLIELYGRAGDAVHAADAARDLVDLDPLNEDGHRALMISYARTGRRGQALRQYLECRRALVEELGVEPTEATTGLQARILAGEAV